MEHKQRRSWVAPIGGTTRGMQKHQDETTNAVYLLLEEQQRTNALLERIANALAPAPAEAPPQAAPANAWAVRGR